MSNIIVFEPHADDAFISLDQTMRDMIDEGSNVCIVTVFTDKKRASEGRAYADSIEAEHHPLFLRESNMNGDLVESEIKIRYRVEGYRKEKEPCICVFPLGLQHPDHIALSKMSSSDGLVYVDMPYGAKQKNQEVLNSAVTGCIVSSIKFPGKRKWRRSTLFPSQSKFFYFEGLEDRVIPEILLFK